MIQWRDTGCERAKVLVLPGILVLLRDQEHQLERHFAGATYNEPTEDHCDDGRAWRGVARRSRLLTDLADVTGLTEALSQRVGPGRRRRSAHDPGRPPADTRLRRVMCGVTVHETRGRHRFEVRLMSKV